MKNQKHLSFFTPLLITYILWTAWCIVMWKNPSLSNKDNILRALMRIFVVLLPALHYAKKMYPKNTWEFLGLKNNKKGIQWGLAASAVMLIIYAIYYFIFLKMDYSLPTSFVAWINIIIFSPLAEEILFRAVVFQELNKRINVWWAAVVSSLFFVMINLPSMILLDELNLAAMTSYCGSLFVYGLLFAFLFYQSKSLLGPLLPHWVNNLFSLGDWLNIIYFGK